MSEQTNPVTQTNKGGAKRRLTQIETIILERTSELGLPLKAVLENDDKLASYVLDEALSQVREDLIEERLLNNNTYLRKLVAGKVS